MTTLEMVPLRSTLPTGLMTLRFAVPAINAFPAQGTVPELDLDRVDLGGADSGTERTTTNATDSTTTPQVATSETTAGKGGTAR